jgi:misacylated tRNA(Ala) deacylase
MELNSHNKKEYPPMHSVEHILNQTMVKMFSCDRSKNSHIERKKSKCNYFLNEIPTEEQIIEIEKQVNDIINQNLPVRSALVARSEVPVSVDLSKLPEDASETLRLVYIGSYDVCACIGEHVENTAEIGRFKIVSSDYNNNQFRIRFKLEI